jgi:hypothetical protein
MHYVSEFAMGFRAGFFLVQTKSLQSFGFLLYVFLDFGIEIAGFSFSSKHHVTSWKSGWRPSPELSEQRLRSTSSLFLLNHT